MSKIEKHSTIHTLHHGNEEVERLSVDIKTRKTGLWFWVQLKRRSGCPDDGLFLSKKDALLLASSLIQEAMKLEEENE